MRCREVALSTSFDQGRYGATEAARLVGLHPSTVRRWLHVSPSVQGAASPVVRSQRGVDGLLSFLDLVELDLLRRLKDKGVSTRRLIRLATESAAALGVDRPLSRRGVRVETSRKGAHVYLPMPTGAEREGLLHLGSAGQMALKEVVEHVSEWLDFDQSHATALHWWPAGRSGGVVVDPEVAFGEPVVPSTRISAAVLHDMVQAEGGDAERVARLYGLPAAAVRQAVSFAQNRATAAGRRAA